MKGILFDFDDTIGNRNTYSYAAYKELIETYFDISDPFEKENILQNIMLWDMKGNYDKNFIRKNLETKFHLQLPFDNLNEWWKNHQWKYTTAFDGVEEVLKKLHQQYKMALVTNGDNKAQRKKAHLVHIESYFDAIVTSGQVGKKKPAPDVYLLALKELDLSKEDVVYVGDTFSTDIIGAHRLGIKTIWVKDKDWPCSIDIPRISSIQELLEMEW